VGDNGEITTSPDGITWTRRTPVADSLYAVAFGANIFVATGQAGAYYSSPDGITWTKRNTTTLSESLSSVTFGGGSFVASGIQKLLTSPDGTTWTSTTYTWVDRNEVPFVNGMFLIYGNDGIFHTSTNGTTWVDGTTPQLSNFGSVAYDNGTYVFVDTQTGSTMDSTTDLIMFQSWTLDPNADVSSVNKIGSSYLASTLRMFFSSTDTDFWSAAPVPDGTFGLSGGALGGTTFVGISDGNWKVTTNSGTSWSTVLDPDKTNFRDIIYANGGFMAVGTNGANKVYTSADGTNWTGTALAPWLGLAYGNATYVQVGGAINATATGLTASFQTSLPTAQQINAVVYGGGQFVTVGNKGTVMRSATGAAGTWTLTTLPSSAYDLYKVIYTGTHYVAAGQKGYLYTSTDGASWVRIAAVPGGDIKALTWTGTQVLYGTSNGGIGHLVP
jgi:hypothetical protein